MGMHLSPKQVGVVTTPHFVNDQCVMASHIPAGRVIGMHCHDFAHPAILLSGRVTLEVAGVVTTREAPDAFVIPAGKGHRITSLTDVSWWCVWPESMADEEGVHA